MIEHQQDRQRFVLSSNGQDSVLDYKLSGNTVNFTRTFVPESLRGKGAAKQLVDQGLAWAREQGYQIEADCWYVARFLSR
ncbi:GNAT family N-acetyltransferase [Vibrio sp. La 4.2.2]|uniref:GNAT family N-acetyltransferase n=1 Tax=unclassified Vibrio TaxID=2614977 RepID=UPI002075E64E|nr:MULTISPECIES: GNAT family N-acetyltransferase [unclassified Vibrio]MDA0108671.1 GNAT family N-acetyltransferase [Vibrio sp. La 4.2.2]USE02421.1 N-acetyltransferase [Vibrio sp. SCSIO 43133]